MSTSPQGATQVQTVRSERSRNSGYVVVGVLMLVLTLAAVFLVEIGLARAVLMPILIVMAAVQVLLQAFLFMHLRGSRHAYTYFFMGGLSIALLFGTALMILIQQWA